MLCLFSGACQLMTLAKIWPLVQTRQVLSIGDHPLGEYEISMFSDRSSNLNPFQSGCPMRFAPCWCGCHITKNSTSRNFCRMVQPHFPIISLRLNSNVVLALPHQEFQSRIPGLEGEAWILTLMSGIRRLSLIFSSPVHSYRRHPKTLKLTVIISPFVKIYFILSYHFSNLARLALEPH